MTLEEMFRLQGINPGVFTKAVPDTDVGQQIGNALSANVVERLLLQVFKATKCKYTPLSRCIETRT